MEEKNLHRSHRARMKARFSARGLDDFADHEVLELLLFYAVPQRDTNPLAHRLVERYGSFAAVFDAPVEDLLEVEGVGEHTATLIKLIPDLARRYCESRFAPGKDLDPYDVVGTHLVSHFLGRQNESVYAMFYSSTLQFLYAQEISQGGLHSASFSMRDIASAAILKKASYVILAHNHPDGVALASGADLDVTREVRSFLLQMEVQLLDHFVVSEGKYTSLMKEFFHKERSRILELKNL